MVSVISTLMLDVSHAVEVLVFMFAGGVRCHTSVVFLNTVIVVACVIFIPGFSPFDYQLFNRSNSQRAYSYTRYQVGYTAEPKYIWLD